MQTNLKMEHQSNYLKFRKEQLTIKICLLLFITLLTSQLFSQNITQTIRGSISDQDSKFPLFGANVIVLNSDPFKGTTADLDGNFKIEEVTVGRHTLQVSFIGYEPLTIPNIEVTSGKELVLDLTMSESMASIKEVVITGKDESSRPLNEMAAISARSFSIEETKRYAAAFLDPARMAQNFAGVNQGRDDLSNEIVVRGNSPKYVQYKLEGIQIPNPTHYAAAGGSGGAISMLSSSTLGQSDFYTGAFPSEIGNALGGVFDLKLRTGNNEKRESALMFGALGLEGSTEGPFKKGKNSSYLLNFRYSTLAILDAVGLDPAGVGEMAPTYSDVSFKMKFPTKKAGTFSVFGLGGINKSRIDAVADSAKWEYEDDIWSYEEVGQMGIVGASHFYMLNDNSYLRTTTAVSYDNYDYIDEFYDTLNLYKTIVDELENFQNGSARITSFYNNKFDSKNTLRVGGTFSYMSYIFKASERDQGKYVTYLNEKGSTGVAEGFAQWKHKLNKKTTLNAGFHYTNFLLNGKQALEPRLSASYKLNQNSSVVLSAGNHSQVEHVMNYLVEREDENGNKYQPNKNLDLTKATHIVGAYKKSFSNGIQLSTEVYYQHLYSVPLDEDTGNIQASIINAENAYDVIYGSGALVSKGEGRNYGIDISIDKPFKNGYYWMTTASLFNSEYKAINKKWYNTKFNSNFNWTVLAGKEFKVGKTKNNTLGVNGKTMLAGGNRYTPTDEKHAAEFNERRPEKDGYFSKKVTTYFRPDIAVNYTINRPKLSHRITLEIQNVANIENIGGQWYDLERKQYQQWTQTGLFPNFNYRIEF